MHDVLKAGKRLKDFEKKNKRFSSAEEPSEEQIHRGGEKEEFYNNRSWFFFTADVVALSNDIPMHSFVFGNTARVFERGN